MFYVNMMNLKLTTGKVSKGTNVFVSFGKSHCCFVLGFLKFKETQKKNAAAKMVLNPLRR